jgi:ActR/RegA family two-component response regulator
MDAFFGAGGKAQQIPIGVSGDPKLASTPHHDRLRVERNKIAPRVRELAEAGKSISETAKALHMHVKRVALIASENKFRFVDS